MYLHLLGAFLQISVSQMQTLASWLHEQAFSGHWPLLKPCLCCICASWWILFSKTTVETPVADGRALAAGPAPAALP
jgi:hypothetical protein